LKVPHGAGWAALAEVAPHFVIYILSFIYLAIYWNNHHHLLHAVDHVSGGILWSNLHLLFWLSLVPFVTGWMSENHFAALPVALYGVVLLLSALAFVLLTQCLIVIHGKGSQLARSIHGDAKGKISIAIYAVAIPLAFVRSWIALGLYAIVATLWFVPDRRIEKPR
jgi:uncharacterized membrane protein